MTMWIIVALMTIAADGSLFPMQRSGVVYIWDGDAGDGKWRTSANWRTAQYDDPPNGAYPGFDGFSPTTNDTAVLPSASTSLTLDGRVTLGSLDLAGSLTLVDGALTVTRRSGLRVRPGAALIIGTQGILQLTGEYGYGSHTIDGTIALATSSSVLKVAHSTVDAYAQLGGSGQLLSAYGDAVIVVEDPDDLLISGITAAGAFMLAGSGTFDNRGQVFAAFGTIVLGPGVVLTDTASTMPRWLVHNGTMVFLNDAYLLGDFQVGDMSTLRVGGPSIVVTVYTEGELAHAIYGVYYSCYDAEQDGVIDFASNGSIFAWIHAHCRGM